MAKIRVTIMTENDKHLDERYSDEYIEATAKKAWDYILSVFTDPLSDDKATVEKCELIER